MAQHKQHLLQPGHVMLEPFGVICESTLPGVGPGACELANLGSIWNLTSGKDQHGATTASPCPAAYTLVVFDGTWQEAKEIYKVQSPSCP